MQTQHINEGGATDEKTKRTVDPSFSPNHEEEGSTHDRECDADKNITVIIEKNEKIDNSQKRATRKRRNSIGPSRRLRLAQDTTPMNCARYFAAIGLWTVSAIALVLLWCVVIPLAVVLTCIILLCRVICLRTYSIVYTITWACVDRLVASYELNSGKNGGANVNPRTATSTSRSEENVKFSDFYDYDRMLALTMRQIFEGSGRKEFRVESSYVKLAPPSCLAHSEVTSRAHALVGRNGAKGAPVLVALHGTGSSAMGMFGAVMPSLLSQFSEVHALDLPGFGPSTFPIEYRRRVRGAPGRRRRRCCCWCFWCCCCQGMSRQTSTLAGTGMGERKKNYVERRLAREDVRDELASFVLDYIRKVVRKDEELSGKRREVVLLGHSIGSFIAGEAAHIDSIRHKMGRTLISKVILMSPAGLMPVLGGLSSYWLLFFFSGFPFRQVRWFGRVPGGYRFLFEIAGILGFDTMQYYRLRSLCQPRAWLADLPSWFGGVDCFSVRWMDPAILRTIRAGTKIPIALIQGTRDEIIPNHYVGKVAKCLWPEHHRKHADDKGKLLVNRDVFAMPALPLSTRNVSIYDVRDKPPPGSSTSETVATKSSSSSNEESERDNGIEQYKRCGASYSLVGSPVFYINGASHDVRDQRAAFLHAVKLSVASARRVDRVSRRFADMIEESAKRPAEMRLGALLSRSDTFRTPFLSGGADEALACLYDLVDRELERSYDEVARARM